MRLSSGALDGCFFDRLLKSPELNHNQFKIVGVLTWPPSVGNFDVTGNACGGALGQGGVASSQGGAASSQGGVGACQGGAASGHGAAMSQESLHEPSWPRYKALKLMLSGSSNNVPGPVSAASWHSLLGDELGRGSYGVVRKASRHGQLYAVKVMSGRHRVHAYQDTHAYVYLRTYVDVCRFGPSFGFEFASCGETKNTKKLVCGLGSRGARQRTKGNNC